jgi:hypothetical protein
MTGNVASEFRHSSFWCGVLYLKRNLGITFQCCNNAISSDKIIGLHGFSGYLSLPFSFPLIPYSFIPVTLPQASLPLVYHSALAIPMLSTFSLPTSISPNPGRYTYKYHFTYFLKKKKKCGA